MPRIKRKSRRIKARQHDSHIKAYHLFCFSPQLEEELRGYVYQD